MKKNVLIALIGAIALCVCVCVCVWYSSKPSNELFKAVENRDLDGVKEALKTVDINTTDNKGRTAVMVAAKRATKQQWSYSKAMRNLEIIEYLVDSGADITVEDKEGLTLANYICGHNKFTYWKIPNYSKRDKLEGFHWYLRTKICAKVAQASPEDEFFY